MQFDPRLFHTIEPVTSGRRVSIALFSPRAWKRLPPHSLVELADIGFYPPFVHLASSVNATKGSSNTQADDFSTHDLEHDNDTLPSPLTVPTTDEEKELQEWCEGEYVNLPYTHLSSSDGSISPLTDLESEELRVHIDSGHTTKCNQCRGCLEAEGPRHMHRSIRDIDKSSHVLHIDIAGPLPTSEDGFNYFLVGALRLRGYPLLIDIRLLQTRTSVEVCHQLGKMIAFFESIDQEGIPITDMPRIRRLHSDRAGEFLSPYFENFMLQHRSIRAISHFDFRLQPSGEGYNPQANGTAERSVGLIKAIAGRALASAKLGPEFWSFAARFAAQSLLCYALQMQQKAPPFGCQVTAQPLGHLAVKFPYPRSVSGRLLFWDHLGDKVSYLLTPPSQDQDHYMVTRAGLPVKTPPNQEVKESHQPPTSFPKPLRDNEAPTTVDLDAAEACDDPASAYPLPTDCPFTFLYLSSEDSSRPMEELEGCNGKDPPPIGEEELRKQAVTHINVSPEEVLRSTGDEWKKWLTAGKKELDNLATALTPIPPEKRNELKMNANREGYQYTELPGKVLFSIKPEKYKVRIVACGNKTDETYGHISTTDLDTTMMRFILSWSSSYPRNEVASLDVTAAFLNADLPPGRVVVIRPPTILYRLGLIPQGYFWLVHKAVYGLREAPSLWSDERTKVMANIRFRSQGEVMRILMSQVHRSLCHIVREKDIITSPTTDDFGLTSQVSPEDIKGLIGIYVDDYLASGSKVLLHDFFQHLRGIWKTSDPLYLSPGMDFPFLGVTVEKRPYGLLIHQEAYTNEFLKEYGGYVTARQRTTTGEPGHFAKEEPISPDPSNEEHQAWVKRGQKILGALLWLSTRTRPDLACSVSLTAQLLTKDIEGLKCRLRHLIQYLKTTRTMALLYSYPRQCKSERQDLSEFSIYSDASFAPSGKHSQSGLVVHLTYGSSRHLVHWQSSKERKIAESSAEAELYALATAKRVGQNIRLLVRETLSPDVILTMRCDNTATISMLDQPTWRTRYISIHGESLRQEMEAKNIALTYVGTELQLADPLTKPTSAAINQRIYPLWGLIPYLRST